LDNPADRKISAGETMRAKAGNQDAETPRGSLMDITQKSESRGVAAYDALNSAGLIKNTVEFLEAAV
jgi:hypothetical protein